MPVEGMNGNGSMYGVVDNMHVMAGVLEELLQYLPKDFVWPSIVGFSPFSAYLEWGHRENTEGREKGNVWLTVNSGGCVRMNYDLRPGWPECGAEEFNAAVCAEWLKELTKNWEWEAGHEGSTTHTQIKRSY